MAFLVNVPNAPGVPPVARAAASYATALLTGDSFPPGSFLQQWGLYLEGQPVITADSVIDMTYRQDWSICDYPLEQGAFESYNKVQIPFDARLRFSAGGSIANREALLASVAAVAGTLTLFSAVTPEVVYPNVNVHHYDYRRTSTNGLGLMVVDVWLQEVRITTQGSGSNVAAPSAASAVSGGTVQGAAPSAAESGASWT
jgi:hypothetical protein